MPLTSGHLLQGVDEGADAGRAQAGGPRRQLGAVVVAAAVGTPAGDRPAAVHVGLPLAAPRQEAEHHEDVDEEHRHAAARSQASPVGIPYRHRRHGRRRGRAADQVRQQRRQSGEAGVAQHRDAQHQEAEVVHHVLVLDVADLVAEDRLDLVAVNSSNRRSVRMT